MEKEWENALRDFRTVWMRVQEGRAQTAGYLPEVTGSAELEQAIRIEAERQQDYSCAACRTKGRCAETLYTMAAQCGRNLRQLQREYFLSTGDTLVPDSRAQPEEGLPGLLRQLFLWEGVSAGTYLALSAAAESEERRLLFGDLSQRCSRRREKLRELIGQMLG